MKTQMVPKYTLEPPERLAIIVRDGEGSTAIGSGITPTPQQVRDAVAALRYYCRNNGLPIDQIYESVMAQQDSEEGKMP